MCGVTCSVALTIAYTLSGYHLKKATQPPIALPLDHPQTSWTLQVGISLARARRDIWFPPITPAPGSLDPIRSAGLLTLAASIEDVSVLHGAE